jgi:2-polyprenyl-3-methyl-5-hydroxy-6-metoxy-1,4-benzoquinol methylase
MPENSKNTSFTFLEHTRCPSCKSKRMKFIGMRGGKYQREGRGIETRIVRCSNCTLIFPNPFPIPESLESIYGEPEEFFANKSDWATRSKEYEGLAEKFISEIGKKEKIYLLDVGAGRGEFMQACLSFPQIECTGIEVSKGSINYAAEKGIEVINKLLSELINEGKVYDGICLNAVLEHVHDPLIFMSEISSLLKKEGVLYIDSPREPNLVSMLGNLSNKIMGDSAVYNLQPTWDTYHVYGFNPKSLRILLGKNNIKITNIRVHGYPCSFGIGGIIDSVKAFTANQIEKLGNLLGLGSNMYVWCKKA